MQLSVRAGVATPGSQDAADCGCPCTPIKNSAGDWPIAVDGDSNEIWDVDVACPLHGLVARRS